MKLPKTAAMGSSLRAEHIAGWGFGHYLATWVLFVTLLAHNVLKVEQAQESKKDF